MRTYRKSNIFLFLVFLLPGLVSCCKIQDESPAMPISGSGGCTVTVTCVPEAQTAVLTRGLTPEEESRIADVNLWAVHTLTGIVEHRYLHGAETVPLTLTQGRWRLYAVANHGSDLGTLDAEAVEALRADIPPHAPDDTDFLLPMAGRTETDVSGPASVTLTLERLAARVRLDIETAPEIAGRLNILEVQPLSVPSGVVCFSGDAVGEFGDWPPQECGTSAFSAVYYLPENLAGEIPHIASPEERTHLNAPEDATGFRISTLYEGKPVYYHVYPGDNGTSDFNLRRNRTYVLNVTLCGANPEDARVAACDMTLTPSAGEVQAGQTFSTRLCFTARNNADNTFDLAWRFISGEAEVSVSGGLPDPPGVFYYGLAGNEIDEYFDIAVTSDREGPVELEFYSTDRYGQVFARRVTVNFLAADRIDFTVMYDYGVERTNLSDSEQMLRGIVKVTVVASEPLPAPLELSFNYYWTSVYTDDPYSPERHSDSLGRIWNRISFQRKKAFVLFHSLQLSDCHIVALIDSANRLVILCKNFCQQFKQHLFAFFDTQGQNLCHQDIAKAVYGQSWKAVCFSKNQATVGKIVPHNGFAVINRMTKTSFKKRFIEFIICIAGNQTNTDFAVFVCKSGSQIASLLADNIYQLSIFKWLCFGNLIKINPRMSFDNGMFCLFADLYLRVFPCLFHLRPPYQTLFFC